MSRIPAAHVKTKRIYDAPAPDDGTRILVDRLWPRGISKDKAAADLWLAELAPSKSLRTWFDHQAIRWPTFRRRYAAELAAHRAELKDLREKARQGSVTLLYAAHDRSYNNAVALRAILLGR
jgi:uncharacterized protein YeaO (DUF488 family)